MNRPTPILLRHLLTRSDLATMQVQATEVFRWLAEGGLEQIGEMPRDAGGDPVFTVLSDDLRADLAARLARIGKTHVVLTPLGVRSFLLRAMLQQRGAAVGGADDAGRDELTAHLMQTDLAEVLHDATAEVFDDVEAVVQLAAEISAEEWRSARFEPTPDADAAGTAPDEAEPEDEEAAGEQACFDFDALADELGGLDVDDAGERASVATDDEDEDQEDPEMSERTEPQRPSRPRPGRTPEQQPEQPARRAETSAEDDDVVPGLDLTATELTSALGLLTGAREDADDTPPPAEATAGAPVDEEPADPAPAAPTPTDTAPTDEGPTEGAAAAEAVAAEPATATPPAEDPQPVAAQRAAAVAATAAAPAESPAGDGPGEPPADEFALTNAAMDKVQDFLGELRHALVELAQRPQPQPVDVRPLVEAMQAGFERSASRATETSTALASLAERMGDFGGQVEDGVAETVRTVLESQRGEAAPVIATAGAPGYVAERADRQLLVLGAAALLVLCWSILFWIKTGSPRLALGTLVGANLIGCCLLLARRDV